MAESTVPSSRTGGGDEAKAKAKVGYFRPLRNRDFRLLVAGQTTSTVGDFLFIVAFPFLLLDSHAGAGGLGVALAVLGVTRVVGTLTGGMLADRVRPRIIMIVADTSRVLVLGWLAYALAAGSSGLWLFVIAATAIGFLEGLFLPAYRAITPAVLPAAELAAGNSAGEALNTVAAIAGQLVAGGALTLLGRSGVVGVDAATFLVSAGTLIAMRAGPGRSPAVTEPQAAEGGSAQATAAGESGRPAGAGFRGYALRSRLFLTITLMTGMVSITASGLFAVGLPVLADRRFSDGPEAYGILLVGLAIGRLVGSVAAGRLVDIRGRGYLTIGLLVAHGVVLTAIPSLHMLGLLVPVLVVLGFADGTLLVIVITVVQQMVPREMLGRAMAVMTFMQIGSFPISVALAGLVVDRWGLATAFGVGGAGVLAVALLGACQRVVRNA
jgi:MFS family permease